MWCAQRLLEARAADADAAAELRCVMMECDTKTADLKELDQLHAASTSELAQLGGQHEAISALQERVLLQERDAAQAAYAQRRRDWQTEFDEERCQAKGALADLRRQAQARTLSFTAVSETCILHDGFHVRICML